MTNTQLHLLMKNGNSAAFAIHISSNDLPQRQLQKIQSYDKTQFRVRLHHLANRYVLKRKMGAHLWSHPDRFKKKQRNPSAPTFGERSIEGALRMEEQARKSAWVSHTQSCTQCHVRILRVERTQVLQTRSQFEIKEN